MSLEGKKVKLKVDQMLEKKGMLSHNFVNFLNENKDTIFTVKEDEKHRKEVLYTLKENDTWLFWEGDLEVVK